MPTSYHGRLIGSLDTDATVFSFYANKTMVKRAVKRYRNVEVDTFEGLLAEAVRKYPGAVLVKGLRATSDFEYEFQMNLINKKINPRLETMVTFLWGTQFLALGIFASGLLGGLLGFLVYNYNPAKVFMGDTGSLFLGGAIAALAFAFDMDDLVSIGTIGLIKGINTYCPDKGVRLATYASRCTENEILMHFRSQKKSAGDVSLSDTLDVDGDGNSLSLMDIIAQEDDMADRIGHFEICSRLREYVDLVLDRREAQIIRLRYGLDGAPPKTQRETADACGISRSYVSERA